jgi:hypothetical protein
MPQDSSGYRIVGQAGSDRYMLVDKNLNRTFDQIGTAQEVWLYEPAKGTGLQRLTFGEANKHGGWGPFRGGEQQERDILNRVAQTQHAGATTQGAPPGGHPASGSGETGPPRSA